MSQKYVDYVPGEPITINTRKIKIHEYMGTWCAIDELEWKGQPVFLLKHETYGDDVPRLIVDSGGAVIGDDVWIGSNYSDYIEYTKKYCENCM